MSEKSGSLQREIRQTKPFRSRQQEAALGLARTAALLKRHAAHAVGAHGLSPEQYNVLRILRGASPESLPTLDIVERMIEPSPAITRLLDKLEAKKLVWRVRCPKDRRQVLCSITSEGLELLGQLDYPVDEAVKESIKLKREDLDTLIRLLDQVRAGLAGELRSLAMAGVPSRQPPKLIVALKMGVRSFASRSQILSYSDGSPAITSNT